MGALHLKEYMFSIMPLEPHFYDTTISFLEHKNAANDTKKPIKQRRSFL
tara:strand:+ start:3140 stop:3286 length:147 start_codon:yes stop_codon:yes gene_type:complete